MSENRRDRWLAILEGIIVTVLWASSFPIGKIALEHITPFWLAGFRYSIAACVLLIVALFNRQAWKLPWRASILFQLVAIGLLAYSISQGLLFVGLQSTSATTSAWLYFCIGPVVVFAVGALWLKERPLPAQFVGLAAVVVGGSLFAARGLAGTPLGISFIAIGAVVFSGFSLIGRHVARTGLVSSLCLTAIPLVAGSIGLFSLGLIFEGSPRIPTALDEIWIVGVPVLWLALMNTASANMLWNHALRRLMAFELNAIGSAVPLEAAIISWFLIGEDLTPIEIAGLVVVVIGILLVQHPSFILQRLRLRTTYRGRT